MAEKDNDLLNYYYREKSFSPCQHCANIFTDECLQVCTPEKKYRLFRPRPGTGVKELPAVPVADLVTFPDAHFRLTVITLYLAAITDYLQHQDEYEFREKAPHMKKRVPDNFRLNFTTMRRKNARDTNP